MPSLKRNQRKMTQQESIHLQMDALMLKISKEKNRIAVLDEQLEEYRSKSKDFKRSNGDIDLRESNNIIQKTLKMIEKRTNQEKKKLNQVDTLDIIDYIK